MKKILLTCLVAISVFAADAQSKKHHGKTKKTPSKEARAVAAFNKNEANKKMLRDSTLTALRMDDSLRIQNDSLADIQKQAESSAYLESGMKQVDSINKERYTAMGVERMQQDKADKEAMELAKSAKLNDYQLRQIKLINENYSSKLKEISENASLDQAQKQQQLDALNADRVAKIKTVAGKSKAKKIERQQAKMSSESAMVTKPESTGKQ